MWHKISSAAYKGWVGGSRSGVREWVVGSGYPSDTIRPAFVPKEPSMVSKPHYKAKYHPVTVMDDCEEFHTMTSH